MPRGPKGEKRPADVIGNAVQSCGSRRGRLKRRRSLTMLERVGTQGGGAARGTEDCLSLNGELSQEKGAKGSLAKRSDCEERAGF